MNPSFCIEHLYSIGVWKLTLDLLNPNINFLTQNQDQLTPNERFRRTFTFSYQRPSLNKYGSEQFKQSAFIYNALACQECTLMMNSTVVISDNEFSDGWRHGSAHDTRSHRHVKQRRSAASGTRGCPWQPSWIIPFLQRWKRIKYSHNANQLCMKSSVQTLHDVVIVWQQSP